MLAEFLAYWWPILLLGLALFIVSRPKVYWWVVALPWRLFWRLTLGRKR
jgi:hypothetical protein